MLVKQLKILNHALMLMYALPQMLPEDVTTEEVIELQNLIRRKIQEREPGYRSAQLRPLFGGFPFPRPR